MAPSITPPAANPAGPSVAIIGGGIGGLAAALAISRAGLRVTVFEKTRKFRDVGGGIQLAANGSRIAYRWGLADAIAQCAAQPNAFEVRAAHGKVLTRFAMGATYEEDYGSPHLNFHRARLHQVLLDQLPLDTVRLGHRLTDLTWDGEGPVRLEFEGAETFEADVVIGADGMRSVVRGRVAQALAPDDQTPHLSVPRYSGYVAYRGIAPAEAVSSLSPDTMYLWTGTTGRLLCYPIDCGRSFTTVVLESEPEGAPESWSASGSTEQLTAALSAYGDVAATQLNASTEQIRRWALYDRDPLDMWTSGPVTLLGDAAHPMLPHRGQGASQAFEDAVALSHCLAQADHDAKGLRAALVRYEEIRRPHTAVIQTGARGRGSLRIGGQPAPSDAGPAPDPAAAASSAVSSLVKEADWFQRYDIAGELDGS